MIGSGPGARTMVYISQGNGMNECALTSRISPSSSKFCSALVRRTERDVSVIEWTSGQDRLDSTYPDSRRPARGDQEEGGQEEWIDPCPFLGGRESGETEIRPSEHKALICPWKCWCPIDHAIF